ncbi:MAG: hypothetical protein WBA09_05590 [Candidatus Acidiferrum sp.]
MILGRNQVIADLEGGFARGPAKLNIFLIGISSKPFGNIGGNGNSGALRLGCKPVLFLGGESLR